MYYVCHQNLQVNTRKNPNIGIWGAFAGSVPLISVGLEVEGGDLFLVPNLGVVEEAALAVVDALLAATANIEDLTHKVRTSLSLHHAGS
jgi:hypothetical protein